jgi:sugar O-acyltransferase (sialic acid O-acetyltransferase NeuD family)
MVIIGASGHALEVLDIIAAQAITHPLAFYHPVPTPVPISSLKKYNIITGEKLLQKYFNTDPRFILAIGDSLLRKKMADLCVSLGGIMESVISERSYISPLNVTLGNGINIMHQVIIQPEVHIEEGALINCGTVIHHESSIGKYCQLCPSATITGKVAIGDYTMIGAGATILPKVKIGNNVIVAAGSVVTADVPDNVMVAGVPAVIKKNLK